MNIDNESSFKSAFLGNSQVGKTCLIHRIIRGNFQSNVIPTLYPEKLEQKLSLDSVQYNITLWDIPGKERDLKNSKSFIRTCNSLYFVYDITNRKSFEDLEKYWIRKAEAYISNKSIIYIIGNKGDLYEKAEVTNIEGQNLAKRKNYKFQIISAKEDNNIKLIENDIREYNTNFGIQDNKSFSLDINDDFDTNFNIDSNTTCFGGNKKITRKSKSYYQNKTKNSENRNIQNQSLMVNNSENKVEKRELLLLNNLDRQKEEEKEILSNIQKKNEEEEGKKKWNKKYKKFYCMLILLYPAITTVGMIILVFLLSHINSSKKDCSVFHLHVQLNGITQDSYCNTYIKEHFRGNESEYSVSTIYEDIFSTFDSTFILILDILLIFCGFTSTLSIINHNCCNLYGCCGIYGCCRCCHFYICCNESCTYVCYIISFVIMNLYMISLIIIFFILTNPLKNEFLESFIQFNENCNFISDDINIFYDLNSSINAYRAINIILYIIAFVSEIIILFIKIKMSS